MTLVKSINNKWIASLDGKPREITKMTLGKKEMRECFALG